MLYVDEITWIHSVLTDACDQVHYEIWLNSALQWTSAEFIVGLNGSLENVVTPVPHILGDNLILHARDVEEAHRLQVNGGFVNVPIQIGGNDVIIDQVIPLVETPPDVVTIPKTIIPWARARASPEILWNLHYWLFTNNPDTGENGLRTDQLDYWLGVLQRTGATGLVLMFGYDYYSRGRWKDACQNIADILDFFRLNGFDTYISMGVHTLDEQSVIESSSYVYSVETYVGLFGDRIRGILFDFAWTVTEIPTWQVLEDWLVGKSVYLKNRKFVSGYYHGDNAIACGGTTECIPDVSMVDPTKMDSAGMIHWGFNYDDETWRARRWDLQNEWSHYTLNTLFEHINRYDNPELPYPQAQWTLWEWYLYRKSRLDDARFKAMVFGCYRFNMKPTTAMEIDIKRAGQDFLSVHGGSNILTAVALVTLLGLGLVVAYQMG